MPRFKVSSIWLRRYLSKKVLILSASNILKFKCLNEKNMYNFWCEVVIYKLDKIIYELKHKHINTVLYFWPATY